MGTMRYGHNARISLAVCVLVVSSLLLSAIGFAATTSFQATTDVTGNTIDTDYFTVGIYQYTGENPQNEMPFSDTTFTAVDGPSLDYSDITYVQSGSDRLINGTYELLNSEVYFVIFDDDDDSDVTYSPDIELTMKEQGNIDVDPSYYVSSITMGDHSTELTAGVAYKITIMLLFSATSPYHLSSGSDHMDTIITIGSVKVTHNTGKYTYSKDIGLKLSSTHVLDGVSVDSPYDLHETETRWNNKPYTTVEITRENNQPLSDGGNVNVTIHVDAGKRFLVQFVKERTDENLVVNFEMNYTDEQGHEQHYYKKLTCARGPSSFLISDKTSSYLLPSEVTSNANNWILSGGGSVSVRVWDENGDIPDSVHLKVIFCNPS